MGKKMNVECQVVFASTDTVNRKIKIIDDTIVISNIFVDNIVFYVHGSLKCTTLSTNHFEFEKQHTIFFFEFTRSHFVPILTYYDVPTNEIRHLHYGIFLSHLFFCSNSFFIHHCVQ